MSAKKIIIKTAGTILLLVVAVIIGSGFAIYQIKGWKNDSNVSIGSWQTIGKDKDVNDADLLSIAQIAVYATYPLTKSEVIYLSATKDSEGNEIDPQHDYTIEGKSFDARYWSITAYDQDGFLIKNDKERYSYNYENVQYGEGGKSYTINLSSSEKKLNWLPITNAKKVLLVIRLYQPSDSLRNGLTANVLPVIRKIN
jgi:hypothetical protein